MEIPYLSISDLPSHKQIEIIESIEHIHNPTSNIESLLHLRSLTAFVKRYFESQFQNYKQTISVVDNIAVCKVFIDGNQVSEAKAKSFNHSRSQASILAMQEFNFDLLKRWLSLHKEHLQSYLSI